MEALLEPSQVPYHQSINKYFSKNGVVQKQSSIAMSYDYVDQLPLDVKAYMCKNLEICCLKRVDAWDGQATAHHQK